MKKTKRPIAMLMSLLMVLSALPLTTFAVGPAQAALPGNTAAKHWVAIGPDTDVRGSKDSLTICSDGETRNTVMAFMKFDIPRDVEMFDAVRLNLIVKGMDYKLGANSTMKVFPVDSSVFPTTTAYQDPTLVQAVFKGAVGDAATQNAYAYCGVTEQDALATVIQPVGEEILGATTYENTIDITAAVKSAKAAGETEICFAFIMSKNYSDNNKKSWSDIYVLTTSSISCDYGANKGIAPDGVLNMKRFGGGEQDNICVKYPKNIYLDISETLQSAGYKIVFDGKNSFYGDKATYYKELITPVVWGGYSCITEDTDMYKLAFNNYGITIPKFNTEYTRTRRMKGPNGSEYTALEQLEQKRSDGTLGYEDVEIYLKGTPKGAAGETFNYSTKTKDTLLARYSFWGLHQQPGTVVPTHQWIPMTDINSVQSAQYLTDENGNTGAGIDMTVHFYDKSALNFDVKAAEKIVAANSAYSAFAVGNGFQNLIKATESGKNILGTREVLQDNIDGAATKIVETSTTVEFAANNKNMNSAIAEAQKLMAAPEYAAKYTPEAKAALEKAVLDATNTTYDEGVSHKVDINSELTFDAGKKAADDQVQIDALTKAITDQLNAMGLDTNIQSYTVSFVDSNDNPIANSSKQYKYGTLPTGIATPFNTAPNHDEAMHYLYSWPTIETVTGDKVYKEIKTSERHTWGKPAITKEPTSSTVKDGEYTLTCTETTCKVTKLVPFAKADYSELDRVIGELNDIKAKNPNLTNDVKKLIDDAIAKAENVDRGLYEDATYIDGGKQVVIPGGQGQINQIVKELDQTKTNINNGLLDGSAKKIDYTAFDEAYKKCQDIINNSGLYTQQTVDIAKKALAEADLVSRDLNATIENVILVENATKALTDAVSNAVKKADYSKLDESIKNAEGILKNPEKYTDATIKQVQDALDNANSIYKDLPDTPENQAIIDKAESAITDAVTNVKEKADYSGYDNIKNELDKITNDDGRYTPEEFEQIKKKIEDINNSIDKDLPKTPDNQAIIDSATDDLGNAKAELENAKHYFATFKDADGLTVLGTVKFKANDTFGSIVAPNLPQSTDKIAYVAWLYDDLTVAKAEDVMGAADITLTASSENKEITVKPGSNLVIDEEKDVITNVPDNSTVKDIVDQLNVNDLIYEFRSFDGILLANESLVGTGSTLTVKSGFTGEIINQKTFIISGDVTGDGLVNNDDYITSRTVSLGNKTYSVEHNYFFIANDVNNDGVIDILDTFEIKRIVK